MNSEYHKGRGAQINPKNKFNSQEFVNDHIVLPESKYVLKSESKDASKMENKDA